MALLDATGEWACDGEPELLVIPSNEEGDGKGHQVILDKERAFLVVIGENAGVTIDDTRASTTAIIVGDGASVRYRTTLIVGDGATGTTAAASRFVHVGKDARLDWIDAMSGGETGTARTANTAYLAGDGATAKFRSVFLGTGTQRYAASVRMVHKGCRTASNMLTRSALLDGSEGAYRGLIRILPDARGCDAYQRADTLLLGDGARMDATPILEIGNDDVKCSHGVTLGQVDDEKLFYLESRGIPRRTATAAIVQGFFDQLLISMGLHGQRIQRDFAERLAAQDSSDTHDPRTHHPDSDHPDREAVPITTSPASQTASQASQR